jgi:hypothetical protein
MKVSSCGVAVPEVGQNKHVPLPAKKDAALVCLAEFFKLKLDTGKLLPFSRQNRWIFLPGLGSL